MPVRSKASERSFSHSKASSDNAVCGQVQGADQHDDDQRGRQLPELLKVTAKTARDRGSGNDAGDNDEQTDARRQVLQVKTRLQVNRISGAQRVSRREFGVVKRG